MVHCSAMCSLQGFTMGRSPLLIKPTPKILGMWIHVQGPSSHIIPPSPRSTRYVHHPADSGLLLCGFNVPIKGLKWRRSEGDMSPPVVVWSEAAAAKRFWSLYCMPEWPNKEAELTISTVKLDLCKKKMCDVKRHSLTSTWEVKKWGGVNWPFWCFSNKFDEGFSFSARSLQPCIKYSRSRYKYIYQVQQVCGLHYKLDRNRNT